jgi:hypothetical protein
MLNGKQLPDTLKKPSKAYSVSHAVRTLIAFMYAQLASTCIDFLKHLSPWFL